MSAEEIKAEKEEAISNLIGLSCVVAKDFPSENNAVSFSVRGTLEQKSCYYRLNISTVSFISFTIDDVAFVEEKRITLN